MAFGNQVPDKTLQRDVDKKLMRAGTQSKISASIQNGCVTLTGALQYEHQRRTLVRATSQVSGVRQVVDRMAVQAKRRPE